MDEMLKYCGSMQDLFAIQREIEREAKENGWKVSYQRRIYNTINIKKK
jgi:hypothetical protein